MNEEAAHETVVERAEAPARSGDAFLRLVSNAVSVTLARHRRFDHTGIVDPEYEQTKYVNPRYQESCLLLALAGEHRFAVPDDIRPSELLTVSVRVLDIWLRSLHRNGSIRVHHTSGPDPQATAYGLFAAATTLRLVNNQIPTMMHARAVKAIDRAARYLQHASIPAGPETRPLRFAAIKAAAEWLESSSLLAVAENVKRDGDRLLRERMKSSLFPDDSGAYALALAYLTLSVDSPDEDDLSLWRSIIERCRLSTPPSGLMGGGAEASIACLPVPTGFGIAANHLPEANTQAALLEGAWNLGWFDGLIDPDVPWLTPMAYLGLLYRIARPADTGPADSSLYRPVPRIYGNGSGLERFGDWLLRLAPGGSLGWMHHVPSDSTRLFGSPVGSAMREGPWALEGTRMRHPALTGQFSVDEGERLVVEGQLHSTSIPGVHRTPRRVGFPLLRGRHTRDVIRLAPPHHAATMRMHNPVPYRREIELKDGALTVETFVPGRLTHRLPMIWPGGPYGDVVIGKDELPMGSMVQERRVREMTFRGGPWPDWVVRFDRPVDVLYEPVNIPVTSSPLRYITAGCASVDIVASDRLHMAWRVM
ncbi:MAG: hypothetical protein MAG453_02194 [Calditrichaeota bacterium]|nr:hypothetical protein [Calditrichota bacterium]